MKKFSLLDNNNIQGVRLLNDIALLSSLLFILSFSACSVFSSFSSEPDSEKIITRSGEKKLPFKITVADEINDGQTLFVRAKINSQAAWHVDHVFLQLRGLKRGEIVEQSLNKLSALIEQQHPQAKNKLLGKKFSNSFLSLAIPSKDLDDYQLELVWGKEATESLRALSEPDLVLLKSVKIVSEAECQDCQAVSLIKAELVNNAEVAVSAITLEVSFESPEADGLKAKQLLEGRQIIEIDALNLPPTTEQEIEFEVSGLENLDNQGTERLLSQIPIVKILNYKLDSE